MLRIFTHNLHKFTITRQTKLAINFSDANDRNKLNKSSLITQEQSNEQSVQQTQQQSQLIDRNYNETQVPGLQQQRKYSKLTKLQQQIVSSNKFDLQNPQLHPKQANTSSYPGLDQQLTEINLGTVKVKGTNQVFLSEIDPYKIPDQLNIVFDSEKQLRLIGKSEDIEKQSNSQISTMNNQKQNVMRIQSTTVEQRTLADHMDQQLPVLSRASTNKYSKRQKLREAFYSICVLFILYPIIDTARQLYQFYSLANKIEQQQMKQIRQLKKQSYQRVIQYKIQKTTQRNRQIRNKNQQKTE